MTTTDLRDDEDDIRRLARELQEATAEESTRMVRLGWIDRAGLLPGSFRIAAVALSWFLARE